MRLGLGGSSRSRGSKFGSKAGVPLLPGLVAWYRGDLDVPRDANSNVSSWGDQSGRGNHLLQATSTKRAPWRFEGGPRATSCVGPFDNADDFYRVTYTGGQPEDVFLVVLPSVSGAGNGTIIDGGIQNNRRVHINAANSIRMFAGLNGPTTTCSETVFHRLRCSFNFAASSITVDDNAPVTADVGTGVPSGLCVGIFGDQASDPGDCIIAEIIIYNRILSAAEAAEVQAYLKARYAI